MKKAAFFSALLHLMVLVLLIVGMPSFKKEPEDMWAPIPFEMEEIAEITQSPAPALKAVKKPIKEDTKPAPEPKLEPKPEPNPEPKPVPAPEPKPEPKPEPASEPKLEPKPEAKPAPVVPTPQPKPKPPQKKSLPKNEPPKKKVKPVDDFESVLKDLTDIKKTVEQEDQSMDPGENAASRSVGQAGPKVTISEIDAVRRQVQPCWHLAAGAKNGRQLTVEIRLFMNPDGTVRDARLLPSSESASNLFYRAASESALRAVQDPRCQPFPLPQKKYDQWKVFVISFSPKDSL